MANITVSATSNFDDSGNLALANGDNITIDSGAVLTVNSDVRWAQNAAVIGAVTITTATGGKFKLDGTTVWWIPYDGGTSTVPAIGSTVTGAGSGATGELIGLFTALGVAPTAAGGATPSTGFIKLRSKSGTFNDNENLQVSSTTFAVVNSATGGQRGWIHAVFEESQTFNAAKTGTFEVRGDWFELGSSSGGSGQTFQHVVADYCPALWAETGSGTGIYELWLCAYNFTAGDVGYQNNLAGKFFTCTSAGVITFGNGTSYGYIPPSGAKIRVPNVIISNSNSGDWTANTLPATGTRWGFNIPNGGNIDIDKCIISAYLSVSQPGTFVVSYVGTPHRAVVSECVTPLDIEELGVGVPSSVDTSPFQLTSIPNGGTIVGSKFLRLSVGINNIIDFASVVGVTLTDCMSMYNTGSGTTTSRNCFYASQSQNIVLDGFTAISGRVEFNAVKSPTVSDLHVMDRPGANRATGGYSCVIMRGLSSDFLIDGIDFVADEAIPYSDYLLELYQIVDGNVRNIGTESAYLDAEDQLSYVVRCTNDVVNLKCSRIFVNNLRTQLLWTTNSDSEFAFEDCRTTTETVTGEMALNCRMKGCRFAAGSSAASAAVYGTHFLDYFTSDTVGNLYVKFNEKTVKEPSASSYSITAGAPLFTSDGYIRMVASDEIVYEWPWFILGYTAFTNSDPVKTGTSTTNVGVQYKIDTGSGWSAAWADATGANLSAETIDPATGFKLKLKFAATGACTLSLYAIAMTTTLSAQNANLYVMDSVDVDVVLNNIVDGSRYRIEKVSDGSLLYEGTASGTTVTRVYTHTGTDLAVKIKVRSSNGATRYYPFETQGTITEDGLSVWIAQVEDLIAA